ATFVDLFTGWHALLFGEDSAVDTLGSAADWLHEKGDFFWSADARFGEAIGVSATGDLVASEALMHRAVADARRSGNPVAVARALGIATTVIAIRGGLDDAEAMLADAAELHVTTSDATTELLCRAIEGWVTAARGHNEEAITIAGEVEARSRRAGVPV